MSVLTEKLTGETTEHNYLFNMQQSVRLSREIKKNDHYLISAADGPLPFVHAYCQDRVEVVYGPSCRKEDEIYVQRCRSDRIPVVARRGGGGTVVLSPGMVITVVVDARHKSETVKDIFSRIHSKMGIIIGDSCNLKLEQKGLSDLALGDKKVLGSSLYLSNRPFVYLYQSSLMVNCDVSLFERYLKHPPKQPEYRQGRPHKQFCTTLRDCECMLDTVEVATLFNNKLKSYMKRRNV